MNSDCDVLKVLELLGQRKVASDFFTFSLLKKEIFRNDLLSLDVDLLQFFRSLINSDNCLHQVDGNFSQRCFPVNFVMRNDGIDSIVAEEVGCLVLAGGLGSRLMFDKPKGIYPLIGDKTLFHLFMDKVRCVNNMWRVNLPVAVMTSEDNHKDTVDFFFKYDVGRDVNLSFFSQTSVPVLDVCGNLVISNDGKILKSPGGNGFVFKDFVDSGLCHLWKKQGIKYVYIVFIDNPLENPFDPNFIGFHKTFSNDVSLKVIERHRGEKLGVPLFTGDGNFFVVEYFEDCFSSVDDFLYGNTGIAIVNIDFIRYVCDFYKDVSWHLVKRSHRIGGDVVDVNKFEKFIFDFFSFGSVGCAIFHRGNCFSPVKGNDGPFSAKKSREDLLNFLNVVDGGNFSFDNIFDKSMKLFYKK